MTLVDFFLENFKLLIWKIVIYKRNVGNLNSWYKFLHKQYLGWRGSKEGGRKREEKGEERKGEESEKEKRRGKIRKEGERERGGEE